MLEGVNVALGVSGSIAAVKTVELAHELRRQGATVRAVMSPSSQHIIHPWSLEFATENDVVTDITGRVEHVELCGYDGWADVYLLAPATANTVGKIAHAVDDTPVTTAATTALGSGVPIVIAPAMHEPMYDHPGVLEAIERVEDWGVSFVDPRVEEGKAKIASEEAIVCAVARAAGERPLAGRHVVVTSGATTESIDPVRVLSNRSSGKMGRAVARACYVLGATVTLVHDGPVVPYATVRQVESATEMLEATLEAATGADVLVSAAAIGDYTVEKHEEKLRSGETRTLELEPTPKLLDTVRAEQPSLPIVGFKTETSGEDSKMIEAARSLLERVDAGFVVANDASVMGADRTRALLVHGETAAEFDGTKQALATEIGRSIAVMLGEETA
ncbi:bifunctional phosphopantothenoylcysteine decarboxylase/phosphopantothenate--cysteine ligase CoaBC [Halobacteria archaeon AArc-curdl1]|uniref:Coenzyme A biosynthesis bifunctional protein CoaBC n=1 Tax=Natronosalvus hydrolyticus TaxID=2979988 RepID=A0AAP2Z556_9EURY|nr:bifunctional phosphopantothenoylcysteine decarboxylase/phosphopantothenate--cysteine ligase CoaBC [Halobacteria archaeon AArc-curdl1]